MGEDGDCCFDEKTEVSTLKWTGIDYD
jgi:hypothetical protein